MVPDVPHYERDVEAHGVQLTKLAASTQKGINLFSVELDGKE